MFMVSFDDKKIGKIVDVFPKLPILVNAEVNLLR